MSEELQLMTLDLIAKLDHVGDNERQMIIRQLNHIIAEQAQLDHAE